MVQFLVGAVNSDLNKIQHDFLKLEQSNSCLIRRLKPPYFYLPNSFKIVLRLIIGRSGQIGDSGIFS